MFSPLSLGESHAAVALILALWICVNRIYLGNLPEFAAGTVLSPSLSLPCSLYPFFSLFLPSSPNINPSIKVLNVLFWSLPVFINEMNAGWQATDGTKTLPNPTPTVSHFDWMSCVLLNVTHRPECTLTSGKPPKWVLQLKVVLLAWHSPLFAGIRLENDSASLILLWNPSSAWL